MQPSNPSRDMLELERRINELEAKVERLGIRYWAICESVLWGVAGVPILYIAIRFDRPGGGMLWPAMYDGLHVVLSFLLASVLLRLSRRILFGIFRDPWPHYCIAALLAAGIGGAIEVLQLFTHGDASIRDFIRDILGSAAGLCIGLSREKSERLPFRSSRAHRWLARMAAVAALGLSFSPLARTLSVLNARNRAFPVLCDFEASWERRITEVTGGALLTREPPPKEFSMAAGHFVGKVVFVPDSFSGLALKNFPENWSMFTSLQFEVYSTEASALALELRVHDRKHRNQYSDRFNTTLQVAPGQTTVSIPLAEVRRGPEHRPMDMAHVAGVIIFMANPSHPHQIYLDRFRLQ